MLLVNWLRHFKNNNFETISDDINTLVCVCSDLCFLLNMNPVQTHPKKKKEKEKKEKDLI